MPCPTADTIRDCMSLYETPRLSPYTSRQIMATRMAMCGTHSSAMMT